MEGNRIRHCHLLTPRSNVGSTVSLKVEILPLHTPDFALLPVKAVPRASSRPPLHTLCLGKQRCPHLAYLSPTQHLYPAFPLPWESLMLPRASRQGLPAKLFCRQKQDGHLSNLLSSHTLCALPPNSGPIPTANYPESSTSA